MVMTDEKSNIDSKLPALMKRETKYVLEADARSSESSFDFLVIVLLILRAPNGGLMMSVPSVPVWGTAHGRT